jgi:hypothetical protein
VSAALAGCVTAPTPSATWLDFSTFDRGPETNTALACAPEICPNAEASRALIELPAGARRVAAALRALEPSAEFRDEASGTIHARYVAVTPRLRFRDDVDVLIIPVNTHRSLLAVYSRSRIGLSDLGANAARITRLEKRLRLQLE